MEKSGKKETFLINILYRQNATWQGRILWAESGKSCSFRSALELLKIIDHALEEGSTEADAEKNREDMLGKEEIV